MSERAVWLLERCERVLSGFGLRTTAKWFLLSLLVGVGAGVGAIAFQALTQVVLAVALEGAAGYTPLEPAGEAVIVEELVSSERPRTLSLPRLLGVLAVGGLVSGWLVFTFAPEAEGHGTDAAIRAYHHERGVIHPRTPLIKTLASAITLGTGGSGGREGPIAQIGAGIGSALAVRLKLSDRDRRLLMAAGLSAGVGAIFRAPLAAALFAGEILYSEAEIESDVLMPAAMASIVAYLVYGLALPPDLRYQPLFGGAMTFHGGSLAQALPLLALSLLLVVVAALHVSVFYAVQAAFDRLPLPRALRPALGAVLAGALAIGLYLLASHDLRSLYVLSAGYGALQEAMSRATTIAPALLLLIAFGKILTTALTIGSGGSGGVFGPSIVIGGCLGAAAGAVFHGWWPALVPEPRAYVILGMTGFFAASANAPFSTLLMVFEMTGSYQLLAPALLVSSLCFLLCRRWSLYREQLPTRVDSPAHRGDFLVDVLEGLRVSEVADTDRPLITIDRATRLEDVMHLLPETHQSYFPVVDEGRMVGVFTANDIRHLLYDDTLWAVTVADDIMVAQFLRVGPDDDLNTALRRFTRRNIEELPVVDPDTGALLAMLRRRDVIRAYNQRWIALRREAGADADDEAAA